MAKKNESELKEGEESEFVSFLISKIEPIFLNKKKKKLNRNLNLNFHDYKKEFAQTFTALHI